MALSDADYRTLARLTFKKITIYKNHIHILFTDDTQVQIDRIVYKGRNFPKIAVRFESNNYRFLILQKSYLQARKNYHGLHDTDFPACKTVYHHGNVKMITVGVN